LKATPTCVLTFNVRLRVEIDEGRPKRDDSSVSDALIVIWLLLIESVKVEKPFMKINGLPADTYVYVDAKSSSLTYKV